MKTILLEKKAIADFFFTDVFDKKLIKLNGYYQTEDNSFALTWIFGKKHTSDDFAKDHFDMLRNLFNSSDEVINATDATLAGEQLFMAIYQLTDTSTPYTRAIIKSHVSDHIRQALKNRLREGSYSFEATKGEWNLIVN